MKKILLVDDEPHVIKVLKLFLDKNGYQVSVASNGEQALAKVTTDNPDVVITDIQMPRMTGQELCNKINEGCTSSKPHMIIMTSRTDRELRDWVNKVPNLEFLEKPLSPRKLVNQLRNHFEQIDLHREIMT